MDNNNLSHNVHQSNLTDNGYNGYLQSTTNDVNQAAEYPSSNINYNASYNYTDIPAMNDNILSSPYAYTPVNPVMSSNYVAISNPNEQQYISTPQYYTPTIPPHAPQYIN